MPAGSSTVAVLDRSRTVGQALVEALTRLGVRARHQRHHSEVVGSEHATVVLRITGFRALQEVAEMANSGKIVVVLLSGESPPALVNSYLRAGARHVLPESSTLAILSCVIQSDMDPGVTVLPTEAARDFAVTARTNDSRVQDLTPAEVGWLREVARGRKVHEIATDAGWSERSMFRRLDRIYRVLGVSNRSEALEAARHLGYLSPENGDW